MKNRRVLFLDNAGMPISTIEWWKAIVLQLQDKIIVLESYDEYVHSPSTKIQIPAVVMTKKYVNKKPYKLRFTKENLYARDKGKCSYCKAFITRNESTVDHVKPKSKGGANNWENCVLSCKPCNSRKGSKSVKEANMILHNKPFKPKTIDRRFLPWFINSPAIPEQWKKYLNNEKL